MSEQELAIKKGCCWNVQACISPHFNYHGTMHCWRNYVASLLTVSKNYIDFVAHQSFEPHWFNNRGLSLLLLHRSWSNNLWKWIGVWWNYCQIIAINKEQSIWGQLYYICSPMFCFDSMTGSVLHHCLITYTCAHSSKCCLHSLDKKDIQRHIWNDRYKRMLSCLFCSRALSISVHLMLTTN